MWEGGGIGKGHRTGILIIKKDCDSSFLIYSRTMI